MGLVSLVNHTKFAVKKDFVTFVPRPFVLDCSLVTGPLGYMCSQ